MLPLVPKNYFDKEKKLLVLLPLSSRVSTVKYPNDKTLKIVDAAPSDRTKG